jgi:hypothetical protein
MPKIKWSSFTNAGAVTTGDETVGLRAGTNVRFDATNFEIINVDDVTIDGDTISTNTVNGNLYLEPNGTGHVDVGDPGLEVGNILIDGVAFNSRFRVNDIGNTAPAMVTIHKHSTTQEPLQISARSNSDTTAHATVTANMPLYSMYATGWLNSYYGIFGQIRFSADSTGTLADGSAPGKLELMVTPNGAVLPVTALSINNAGVTTLANALPVGSGGSGRSTATAYGVICGGTTSTAAHQSVASVGTAGQVLTSNGAGALPTFQNPTGYVWTEVTGTTQSMAVDSGYIANNAARVTMTLPSVCSVGDTISVAGKGTGGWKIAQNAGQVIRAGSSSTTVGVAGYLESTNQYDSIELLCITANTDWVVLTGPQGNITVA